MPELAEIQIRPGMSEATDSRMLPMHPQATPRLLQNLRFRQLNRAEKRPGTADLDTTDFPSAGYGCWAPRRHRWVRRVRDSPWPDAAVIHVAGVRLVCRALAQHG
jgi:hypothetical protein